jgi:hypothetical protein
MANFEISTGNVASRTKTGTNQLNQGKFRNFTGNLAKRTKPEQANQKQGKL